jgi:hypothetical protein
MRWSSGKIAGVVAAVLVCAIVLTFAGLSVLYSSRVESNAQAIGTTSTRSKGTNITDQSGPSATTPQKPPLQDTNVPPR